MENEEAMIEEGRRKRKRTSSNISDDQLFVSKFGRLTIDYENDHGASI